MTMHQLRRAGALALVTGLAALTTAAPAAAAVAGKFTASGVYIRRCANTTCVADGQGYPSHSVTLSCYVQGGWAAGTNIWYRLRDNSTGVSGYSISTYVDFNGNLGRC
ncbi:hypothetical protein G7075_17135 [Phycicoccus sp. HDW14]|uniref:hypothetical protein n=1 Tax=Phycicoccus sp. HDW14 TaxID=2714941 RepID=UPI001407C9E8|nr:hypothetical protein [Phycicoccus sp. HDW14]QIM22452.1 hypothetical protein G7075_17135 [Phycicoccus sp. HDW14]